MGVKPFANEDPDSYFYCYAGSLTHTPSKAVFENIWNDRTHNLDLYITIAYVSLNQHKQLQSLIELGEILLKKMESKV